MAIATIDPNATQSASLLVQTLSQSVPALGQIISLAGRQTSQDADRLQQQEESFLRERRENKLFERRTFESDRDHALRISEARRRIANDNRTQNRADREMSLREGEFASREYDRETERQLLPQRLERETAESQARIDANNALAYSRDLDAEEQLLNLQDRQAGVEQYNIVRESLLAGDTRKAYLDATAITDEGLRSEVFDMIARLDPENENVQVGPEERRKANEERRDIVAQLDEIGDPVEGEDSATSQRRTELQNQLGNVENRLRGQENSDTLDDSTLQEPTGVSPRVPEVDPMVSERMSAQDRASKVLSEVMSEPTSEGGPTRFDALDGGLRKKLIDILGEASGVVESSFSVQEGIGEVTIRSTAKQNAKKLIDKRVEKEFPDVSKGRKKTIKDTLLKAWEGFSPPTQNGDNLESLRKNSLENAFPES